MRDPQTDDGAAARHHRSVAEADDARRRGNWTHAARLYLEAAKLPGPASSSAAREAHAVEMQLRAADCHIRNGAVGPGWTLLRAALEQVEIQPPTSPAKALIGSTWRRGRLMLRDAALDGEPEPPSPSQRLRMRVLDGAAASLTLVNSALADALRTHHLAEVGRAGEASERCRALANEIAIQTRIGGPFDKSVKRLLERCAELARATGEPLDEAWRLLALATYEFSHGRWRACVDACAAANEIFSTLADGGRDVTHEHARVAALHWFALAWLGELNVLRSVLDARVLQAEGHKDSLMLLEALAGQPMLVWLAADEVEVIRERGRELLERHRGAPGTTWPESAYRRQQYRDLIAEVHACLYRGDGTPAWSALMQQWRELESAFFLPMRTIGLEIRSARARVAVALVEQLERDAELTRARLLAHAGLAASGWDRGRLLADAKAIVDLIRRENSCVAPALASLLQAALHNLAGRRDEAQIQLDAAVREFSSVDMALHRECARYALGELIGGGEGGQLQDRAEAWMRNQGVVHPRKLAASQAPGFGLA